MLTHLYRKRRITSGSYVPVPARFLLLCLILAAVAGCAAGLTQHLPENLSMAILNQDDPEIVRTGAPAYLLLLDGLIEGDADNSHLLRAAADLYGSYATVFVDDPDRARHLSDRALQYARKAMCTDHPGVCTDATAPYDKFTAVLDELDKDDVPRLYSLGAAWAGWVQAHNDNWQALADIAKIEAVMRRVVQLDENYQHGRAHLYLGIFNTRLPPTMGGQPDQGRSHFEKAIAISDGRDLIDKVEFARRYARLVYDKKLHDSLLREVLAAEPSAEGLTLSNVLAQRQARRLLATSDEYFGE
jgi:hypothetical protein